MNVTFKKRKKRRRPWHRDGGDHVHDLGDGHEVVLVLVDQTEELVQHLHDLVDLRNGLSRT